MKLVLDVVMGIVACIILYLTAGLVLSYGWEYGLARPWGFPTMDVLQATALCGSIDLVRKILR